MSTTAHGRMRQHTLSRPADLISHPAADEAGDPLLVLLQRHQIGLITPAMVRDAERRLEHALAAARTGRPGDPGLLLEQLLTDLGVTLSLP